MVIIYFNLFFLRQFFFFSIDLIFFAQGTIFTYGQTGSGKTYTILGGDAVANSDGILINAIKDLFERIKNVKNCTLISLFENIAKELLRI